MSAGLGGIAQSAGVQRRLTDGARALATSRERLGAGLRINRASDDPAGLSVSARLNSDVRVFTQGLRNINDGLSLLNVAEGALGRLTDLHARILELATYSANGIYSAHQRRPLHLEANALGNEFNRIIRTTKFNDLRLFDPTSVVEVAVQGGYGTDETLLLSLGKDLQRTVGTGTFRTPVTYATGNGVRSNHAADVDGDGDTDLLYTSTSLDAVAVMKGNGDGTFRRYASYSVGAGTDPTDMEFADVNGDGIPDVVAALSAGGSGVAVILGNGDGSFRAPSSYGPGLSAFSVTVGDFTGDGAADVVWGTSAGSTYIMTGNGDGTLRSATLLNFSTDVVNSVRSADLDADGNTDLLVAFNTNSSARIFYGNGDGSFATGGTYYGGFGNGHDFESGDVNNDGITDLLIGTGGVGGGNVDVRSGLGGRRFSGPIVASGLGSRSPEKAVDTNDDGFDDLISMNSASSVLNISLGNGDGTFAVAGSIPLTNNPTSVVSADFNGDGVSDVFVGTFNFPGPALVSLADTTTSSLMPALDLMSVAAARGEIDRLGSMRTRVEAEKGRIGGFRSRLDAMSRVLSARRENYAAAASRITDVDVAAESAVVVSNSIRQESSALVLRRIVEDGASVLRFLS